MSNITATITTLTNGITAKISSIFDRRDFDGYTAEEIKKTLPANKSLTITDWLTGQTCIFNNNLFDVDAAITDLTYHFLVCFSGGKDSIAMVLHLLEMGVSKERITLHHHEVDGRGEDLFDWTATASYCISFAKEMGLQLLFSYRDGGIAREIFRKNEGLQSVFFQKEMGGEFFELKSNKGNTTKRKFPAVSGSLCTRWCSSIAKIDVLGRVTTNNPAYAQGNFVICTGERREESSKRSTYLEVEKYRAFSKKRNAWQYRPIINWSEEEVWAIIEKYKVQVHPCYELGWGRCSCQTCIFSSANTWASIFEISPEKVERIAQIESEIDHTMYNGISISEKVEKGNSFLSPEIIEKWGKEAIEEFTKPIIIEGIWELPIGAFAGESSGAI